PATSRPVEFIAKPATAAAAAAAAAACLGFCSDSAAALCLQPSQPPAISTPIEAAIATAPAFSGAAHRCTRVPCSIATPSGWGDRVNGRKVRTRANPDPPPPPPPPPLCRGVEPPGRRYPTYRRRTRRSCSCCYRCRVGPYA
ncbi:unnamed protein product, partial [Ectocarpus sp. 12 AP-2014]